MAWGLEDPSSIPHTAKVRNDVIFFLGVFIIQFNLISLNLIGEPVLMKIWEKRFQMSICCAHDPLNVNYFLVNRYLWKYK